MFIILIYLHFSAKLSWLCAVLKTCTDTYICNNVHYHYIYRVKNIMFLCCIDDFSAGAEPDCQLLSTFELAQLKVGGLKELLDKRETELFLLSLANRHLLYLL